MRVNIELRISLRKVPIQKLLDYGVPYNNLYNLENQSLVEEIYHVNVRIFS